MTQDYLPNLPTPLTPDEIVEERLALTSELAELDEVRDAPAVWLSIFLGSFSQLLATALITIHIHPLTLILPILTFTIAVISRHILRIRREEILRALSTL